MIGFSAVTSVTDSATRRASKAWFAWMPSTQFTCSVLHACVKHLTQACKTLQHNCVVGITANHELLARRVAESVTLVTALNPIIGYEKAALIAKTALASGGTIAQVAEALGIMSQAEMNALLVPERLTQPVRLVG